MSVAVHAADLVDDALRARRRGERLLTYALVASIVLHAAAIAIAPRFRTAKDDPPRPLEVVLVKPPVPHPLKIEPQPPPKPLVQRTPAAKPTPVQPRPTAVAERTPVLALPQTAPAATAAFTVPQAPAETAPAPVESKPVAAAPPSLAPAKEASPTTAPVFNAAYLGNPPPRYPLIARRNGVEGTVLIRVVVSKDGRAAHVQLDKSSGSSALDNAALEAVKGWKFAPARRGQEAVEQPVVVPIVFKLEGSS